MIQKIITPFQKFVKIESFSGILLLFATILALVWANSPFAHLYESLWDYKMGFTSEGFTLSKPLILWVNDGLMAIFFFLIGLEIKRELLIGELNSVKKAAFPFFGALGGMIVPVALFLFLNTNPETAQGWGIPMATDIAFSLAILNVLGKRVPLALKVFLTAFAIIDDLGAVIAIAVFYSSGIYWSLLFYAFGLLALLFLLSYLKVYSKYVFFIVGVVVWVLFLKSGIHPTIAGVLMAFTIPISQRVDVRSYTESISGVLQGLKVSKEQTVPILTHDQIEQLDELEDMTGRVQSPLQHLEHRLHNWVAYLVIPVFALANAGITISTDVQLDTSLILHIVIGLFVGKGVGVSLFAIMGKKLKLVDFPEGVNYRNIIGVALLAGVGFTMSIFISNLAFTDPAIADSAKVGILVGSFISGLAGYSFLYFNSKTKAANTEES
ncbi:Na+/H+ antiporter NhaA [Sunxiuqinia dokdonensis]|uniref:Na(+)/H(+) antiporter NhaA n=1 Tax=Sunxiuqinia dokdonensis TaxID=1409788 RepID=A0A0L8V684_9BACT|nr:Na+/H+ antiporter NhaA [Sunxiuqinia dokdonensis]KOH43868.1 sodium:proton antiporter [Sunxiuqinia dokdonensis]